MPYSTSKVFPRTPDEVRHPQEAGQAVPEGPMQRPMQGKHAGPFGHPVRTLPGSGLTKWGKTYYPSGLHYAFPLSDSTPCIVL